VRSDARKELDCEYATVLSAKRADRLRSLGELGALLVRRCAWLAHPLS